MKMNANLEELGQRVRTNLVSRQNQQKQHQLDKTNSKHTSLTLFGNTRRVAKFTSYFLFSFKDSSPFRVTSACRQAAVNAKDFPQKNLSKTHSCRHVRYRLLRTSELQWLVSHMIKIVLVSFLFLEEQDQEKVAGRGRIAIQFFSLHDVRLLRLSLLLSSILVLPQCECGQIFTDQQEL